MALLSARVALVIGVAAPLLTFRNTDQITGNSLECDRCPPGTFMRAPCTATQKTQCAPCPQGSFTELWNYIGKCLRCGVCGHNEVEKTACTANSNCQCQCKQGYYHKKNYDMCVRHSECPSGQEVLTKGTADEDTVCQTCPDGSYSDTVSLVLKGSIWHDSMCTSCEELKSRGEITTRLTIGAFTKYAHNEIFDVDIMIKWVKASNRTARTVWYVQKMTSLYCNAAFKTRKRQHLCHIRILQYPKCKTISSLIYRYQYNIDILPSPTSVSY
uniref:TNFR-Cys domain-containing protein n=1 Tax=Sander lucioperca TaxID=283035 RepID=A0A8C9XV11_SANLU